MRAKEAGADAREGADELDPIEECLASASTPATSSGVDRGLSAMDDPSLKPPADSKADWLGEMEKIGAVFKDASISDEEKIRALHEALVLRIEDSRAQDDHRAKVLTRLEESGKERERYRTEGARVVATKEKLEASCRELQQQKSSIAKENKTIAEEEETRHNDMKDKFQQAIKDVQEKMDAELEVRVHFLKENDELRGKLLKFTETYEQQEQQLAEQRASRTTEMEVAQTRLKEHEVMCCESRIKTAALEKQNEGLRKSQIVLRDELQAVLGKFDEFHEAVTGSNLRHGECKVEIDTLQSRLADLEKDNTDLRECKVLSELAEEQKVAQKQRDALDKLCDNLQKENRNSQDQIKKLRAQRA